MGTLPESLTKHTLILNISFKVSKVFKERVLIEVE